MFVSEISRKFTLISGVMLITSMFGFAHAQTPNGNALQRSQRTRPGMKVIEITPAKKRSKNYFTIVGAVQRSGVFYSNEHRIPLEKLLTAAGGLAGGDKSSIRIVRNGQAGLQLFYLAEQKLSQEIQAGDVIVVVPAPDQFFVESSGKQFIPVACLGVSERPVVLPLSIDIQVVDQLLIKLKQDQSLKPSLRVLDPLGDSRSNRLKPGTLIFFNSNTIDRNALATVNEFPPAVSLEDSILQARAAKEVQPRQEELLDASIPGLPPSENLQPALTTNNQEKFVSANQANSLLPPPLLANPQEKVITVEEPSPSIIATHIEEFHNAPKPNSPQFGSSGAIEQANGVPKLDLLPEEQVAEISVGTLPENQSIAIAEGNQPSIAPPPPAETRVMRTFNESPGTDSSKADLASPLVKTVDQPALPAKTNLAQAEKNSQSQLISIVLGLAGIAGACLIFSILWSRRERHQLRREKASVTNEKHSDKENHLGVQETRSDDLTQIIDPATPLIEEDVLLPEQIIIHGEPVGHQRIIVHPREKTLRGPHFNSQQISKSAQSISKTRSPKVKQTARLRETVSARVEPSLDTIQPELDVVQVPISDSKKPEVTSSHFATSTNSTAPSSLRVDAVQPIGSGVEESGSGPLERALRILAREKKV